MTPTNALLEPSFIDLIGAIEQAAELSEQRRRHWVCSLRQIAKWLDRPATVVPARWQSVRVSVGQLHHARLGVTAKTLARQAHSAVQPGNDPDPPGRTCRDGAHGGSARRADREPDLVGRAAPPRRGRTGHRRVLAKEWRRAEDRHHRPRQESAANGPRDRLPGPSRT